MHVIQVNVVNTQSLERSGTSLTNVVWSTFDYMLTIFSGISKLGREKNLISSPCFFEPFPQQFYYSQLTLRLLCLNSKRGGEQREGKHTFTFTKPIYVSGVPESDTNVRSSREHFEILFFIFGRSVERRHAHGAKANYQL
jgi:hypothetical protein